MTRKSTLAFCTIALILACVSIAKAQSVSPTTAPSAAQRTLQGAISTQSAKVDRLERELELRRTRYGKTAEELKRIEAIETKYGVSADSFSEIIKNLQAKRIDLLVDTAGLEAKQEAILRAEKQNPDNAAIVEPLEKLVKLRQAKLEQIHKSSSSKDELRSAEMNLLSSKVQLANAKSKKASSSLLSDSLLNTSLALAESKARLAKTEALLNEILPARNELDSSKLLRKLSNRFVEDGEELLYQVDASKIELKRLKAELSQLENDEQNNEH